MKQDTLGIQTLESIPLCLKVVIALNNHYFVVNQKLTSVEQLFNQYWNITKKIVMQCRKVSRYLIVIYSRVLRKAFKLPHVRFVCVLFQETC